MGALSSWPMLALTHHFLVHWSAFRVGHRWGSFLDYAVLGDDIVIADGRVAGSYLTLMSTIGVGIGVHKSLVSRKGVLEFAKRYIKSGVDCSPVPFKEMVSAIRDFESSTVFVQKYNLSARAIASFLGFGYKVRGRLTAYYDKLPSKLVTYAVWRTHPLGPMRQLPAAWLNIKSFVIKAEWLKVDRHVWPDVVSRALSDAVKVSVKGYLANIRKSLFPAPVRTSSFNISFGGTASPSFDMGFGGGFGFGSNKPLPSPSQQPIPNVGLTGALQELEGWGWRKAPIYIDWYEGIWKTIPDSISESLVVRDKFASVLQAIQAGYWDRAEVSLSKNIAKVQEACQTIRFDPSPISAHSFSLFLRVKREISLIRALSRLGEKTVRRVKPTSAFVKRLWYRGQKDLKLANKFERIG